MDKKLLEKMNDQLNKEIASFHLYLAMAAYLEANNLPGFGKWMQKQAHEELSHAMKFFEFINDRGDQVSIEALEKPEGDYKSVKDLFDKTLAHEQKVTASINDLYDAARAADDKAAEVFLHWFISEQVEEEKSVNDVLAVLEMVKDNSPGLIMLDRQMGARQ